MNKTLLSVLFSSAVIGGANFAEAASPVTAVARLNVTAAPEITLTAETMPDVPAGSTPAGTVLAKFDLANTGSVATNAMIVFPPSNSAVCPAPLICLSNNDNAIPLSPSEEVSGKWKMLDNGLKTKTPLQPNTSEVIALVLKGEQNLKPGQYTLTAQAGVINQ